MRTAFLRSANIFQTVGLIHVCFVSDEVEKREDLFFIMFSMQITNNFEQIQIARMCAALFIYIKNRRSMSVCLEKLRLTKYSISVFNICNVKCGEQ